jgi:hypothetical protein
VAKLQDVSQKFSKELLNPVIFLLFVSPGVLNHCYRRRKKRPRIVCAFTEMDTIVNVQCREERLVPMGNDSRTTSEKAKLKRPDKLFLTSEGG